MWAPTRCTPRSSACNASLPHVLVRGGALWNAINNRSLDFSFQECVFFFCLGDRVATADRARIHSASPDQTSALFMLGAVTRNTDGRRRTPRRRCTAGSVRLERVQVRPCPAEGVELADKPTEHPGARRTVMRGQRLVIHREMARVQRDAPKVGTTTTGRRATLAMRCPQLPNAHPLNRRGATRFPVRTRQHGVCRHWGPRQCPREPLATYLL